MLNNDDSEAQKVTQIIETYRQTAQRWTLFRQQILRNYQYVVGEQIDRETLGLLEKYKRPSAIFNLLHPVILSLAGHFMQNRSSMRALPVRQGDEAGAELHTVLVSDYAIGDTGYYEHAKATVDAAIAKIGWLNTFFSTRRNPEGDFVTEAVDPFMVYGDPNGRKLDQSDWRYLIYTGWWTCEEIIAMLPDIPPEVAKEMRVEAEKFEGAYRRKTGGKPVGWFARTWGSAEDWWNTDRGRTSTESTIDDLRDVRSGLYRTVEFHDRRMVQTAWLYNPSTRDKIRIPKEKEQDREYLQLLLAAHPGYALKNIALEELWLTVIAPGLLPNRILLEMPYVIQEKGFAIKPVICYDWHPDLTQSQGVADAIISPQDAFNQRHMSMMDWLLDSINPTYDAPAGSIDAQDIADWTSPERGKIRFYKPVGQQKPEARWPNPHIAQALSGMSEEHKDLVAKISGIPLNLQGHMESATESGVLFSQRVQAGMTNLAYLNRHSQETLRFVFNYMDRLIQEFLTLPRAVRVLGQPVEGMEGVQIPPGARDYYWLQVNWPTLDRVLNDVRQGEFDFRPDQTQLGETAKQLKFLEAMEMVRLMPPDYQMAAWPMVVRLWDSPVADELHGLLKQLMTSNMSAQEQQRKLMQSDAVLKLIADAKSAAQPASVDPAQMALTRMQTGAGQ